MKPFSHHTYFSKKTLFILFLLLNDLQLLNAQQKFVEVTVADTVIAEANTFIYKIIVSPTDDLPVYSDTSTNNKSVYDYYAEAERKNKSKQQYFDSLMLVLKKQKFNFLQHSINNNFAITQSSEQIYSEEIVLNSFDSLSLLYNKLKGLKKINGFVAVAKAKNESYYQNILYKKIIDQAYKKARSIAEYSKQKIGNIISVTENKADKGGWTIYPPLSALGDSEIPGWHTNLQSNNENLPDPDSVKLYSISSSFTIRFSAE
jgi:hypothetical protein